ncbi:thiamine pyrophosphate-dependent enzyme, partial [Ralstonia pseudosolanacearum]|uniref:thiamine pyrophosphate-dependent enzyme n=1 Tax=Ralstonia pseudosolanacearum TaxID=1310165 RepID=UPI003CEC4387
IAHPNSLVIDIAGDASVQMTMQEMSAAVQYEAPIKIFILNNQYMGMVRQWQQLLHGNRLSHSYTEALPDFVKLAEAYGGHGIRCEKPGDLDDVALEQAAGVGVGDHDRGDVGAELGLEVGEIDAAVLGLGDFLHRVADEGGGGGVGAVGAGRDQDTLASVALGLVGG